MSSAVSLEQALALQYRFNVVAQPEGGFVIQFPDLPGCMTQIDDISDAGDAAEEIRVLWLETAHQLGQILPAPMYPEEFSGKFNIRIPKSLHRDLALQAAEEGVSLNQFVVSILANRAIWPGAITDPRTADRARQDSRQADAWRPIAEFSEVDVELGDPQETHSGNWNSHAGSGSTFANETKVTMSKVVPFSPRRRSQSTEGDEAGIERAV